MDGSACGLSSAFCGRQSSSLPRPSLNASHTEPAGEEVRARLDAVPDDAVRRRLSPSDNSLLGDDSTEFWVAKVGGYSVNPYKAPDPNAVPLPRPDAEQSYRS